MVGSKDADEISNARVSFAEKANEAMFSSTGRLPTNNRVFTDLIDAQNDK